MKRFTAIALVLTLAGATQAQVVTSEKTVSTQTDSAGGVQTTTEHKTESHVATTAVPATVTTVGTTPGYWTRLESAYQYAGVPASDVQRLRDIDMKVLEARRTNPSADVHTYYVEQQKILHPEQFTKVRTYLTEHKPVQPLPGYAVTTYETVPTHAGFEINTPLGHVGLGIPTGSKVVEKTTVVPGQQ